MNLKWIMLILFVIATAFELWTHILTRKSVHRPTPENVTDVYDEETYSKWLRYADEKTKLSIGRHFGSSLLAFLLLALNVYAFAARPITNDYPAAFIVLLVSIIASLLIEIPTDYYNTMSIEERYGFNRSTKKTFWTDQVKNLLINVAINFGIVSLFILLYEKLGDAVLILFAALLFVIILFISFLLPVLMKIFNKFTPMEEGELKTRLTELLERHGYKVRDIKIMDASRRTTKSNAFFTGFGKMKTIVLYDNLVNAFTDDEICAVFAHEMGHGIHKDVLKGQILSLLNVALITVLMWVNVKIPEFCLSFGFDRVNYGFAMILLMETQMAFLSPLLGLLTNAISRKHEFRVDEQAVNEGYGEALISGLKKLARVDFSMLSPSPLLVKLTYDHPPLAERIDAIRKKQKENE